MNSGKFRFFGCLVSAIGLCFIATAQSPVTLTVDARAAGWTIPEDFCGLSFGAVAELPERDGALLFSPTNSQLITLFTNSGIRNLRLGGTTVEGLKAARPSRAAIDNLFGFAKAAGLRVIYSLPLLNGNPDDDAATAKYIWDRYRPQLECFALGNEPDVRRYRYPPFGFGTDPDITNFATFLVKWRRFAAAVNNAVPDAKFAGPDAASSPRDGRGYAVQFTRSERASGFVVLATQHYYAGGSPYVVPDDKQSGLISVSKAIGKMLSAENDSRKYPAIYKASLLPILNDGMPYRMTESDDCLKGVPGASDAFASALWGLDYLHWWAAHGASGVNFHNTEWLKTDTVYFDPDSRTYRINPKAYSIKAFDLGARGAVKPVTIENTRKLDLTAYAVGKATKLYVTIINKEHGEHARAAVVTIVPEGFSAGVAEAMFLTAPGGDVAATNGITLGGDSIRNDAVWRGQWTRLKQGEGNAIVTVPAATAVVVKISGAAVKMQN